MPDQLAVASRQGGVAAGGVFGASGVGRAMFALFCIAAFMETLAETVTQPLQRPILADLVVAFATLRVVFEVRALRQHMWLAGWVLFPAIGSAVLLWEQARDGMAWSERAAYTFGPAIVASVLLATTGSIRPVFMRIWRIEGRAVGYLPMLAGGALFSVLQLAELRGDPALVIMVEDASVSAIALLAALGIAFLGASAGWRGLALLLALGSAHALCERLAPAYSPVTMGALGCALFGLAFPRTEQAQSTVCVIAFGWASGSFMGLMTALGIAP